MNTTLVRRMSDSDKDRPLIEALVIIENTLSPKKRHICNGRFLTMHKRRRKKLQTRSLAYDPAMLDDILHGQVQCILDQVGNWRFNAFSLETVTGGNKIHFSFGITFLIFIFIDKDAHCQCYVFICFIGTDYYI